MTCVNVATLAKKLEALLGWGHHVFAIAEVRASIPQQRALMRRAARLGVELVFSSPLLLLVPHAKLPLEVLLLAQGALCVSGRSPLLLLSSGIKGGAWWLLILFLLLSPFFVCAYCYPENHPMRTANEALIVDIFRWTSKLTQPVVVCGDFNSSISSSAVLTLSHVWGMHRVGNDLPTTRNKNKGPSKGQAIDHIFDNRYMADCAFDAEVTHDRYLSDHFPIDATFVLRKAVYSVTKPMKLPPHPVTKPEWRMARENYVTWCDKAVKWVSTAFDVPPESKLIVHIVPHKFCHVQPEGTYQTILAAQRSLAHIRRCAQTTQEQHKSLSRKLMALGVKSQTIDQIEEAISDMLKAHLDDAQKIAVADWKSKVKAWDIQQKDLFKFLRNRPPVKTCALLLPSGAVSHPSALAAAFHSYWGKIDSWRTPTSEQKAFDRLDDHCSLYLPRKEAVIDLSIETLLDAVKTSRKSAPSLDGWSWQELKALPKAAWEDVLDMWQKGKLHTTSTTLNMYRRVPIAKYGASYRHLSSYC